MKIAYIDMNTDEVVEDYSIHPKRYGGGACFARWAKEHFDDFFIHANPACFDNIGPDEAREKCIPIDWPTRSRIRNFEPIQSLIPNASQYDLFVHHQAGLAINTSDINGIEVCWAVGYGETVSPKTPHVILYNEFQKTNVRAGTTVHSATIGKPVPLFAYHDKEDFIFQCTRHNPKFGSINVAQICIANKIKCIFAGPIEPTYPLLDFIDNEFTFYLGKNIDEAEKLEYTRRSKLYTFLHYWYTPFNLSAIEALGEGTPIICRKIGFWPSLVQEGVNGFFFNDKPSTLVRAFNEAQKIDQIDCWNTAQQYSKDAMLASFGKVFQNILGIN